MRLAPERHPIVRFRGLELRLDLAQYPSQELFWLGSWEPRDLARLEQHVRPGMVAVDAGANIGMFTTVLARLAGAAGHVHAFEPHPDSFGLLVENIRRNDLDGRVTLNQLALSDRVGELLLDTDAGASASLAAAGSRRSVSTDDHRTYVANASVPVRTMTLDGYAAQLDSLDFVKVDVEGHEPLLLAGAEATLRRFRPVMVVECSEFALTRAGSSRAELFARLENLGYRVVARSAEPTSENVLVLPTEMGTDTA